jgi:hypothetical protein
MHRGPLDVALCITLFAGLVVPFFLRHVFAQEGYRLADSAAVQRLPDRQGGLWGMKTSVPRTVALPDGTNIVVYVVEKIDSRARPPFKNGDVLYAVNGVLFTSLDGMPRYVQSLAPGSTATVEILKAPRKRWHGRTVPVEEMPSVSATVGIFSTTSKYACPTCPKPPPPSPEQKLREDLHVAKMAVAGYAMGTVIQAILNTVGLGPEAVFEHIMKTPPPLKETGPTREQINNIQGRETPQKPTDYGFKAKPINPHVHGDGPGAR